MWDSIEPTRTWIDQHIPFVVCQAVNGCEEEGNVDLQTLYQAKAYITAGCCFAIGLRYAGSCKHEPYNCLVSLLPLSLSLALCVS